MSAIPLSTVINTIFNFKLHIKGEEALITEDFMIEVIASLFADVQNSIFHAEILTNWLLNIFDVDRLGCIKIQQFKISLALLCATWIEEKLRYIFGVLDTDGDALITKDQAFFFIHCSIQILESISESASFGPQDDALQAVVNASVQLEKANDQSAVTNRISITTFVDFMMQEPRPIIWLATMHRIAATENSKHDCRCHICKSFPIVGFRYKNMSRLNVDLCQECFWSNHHLRDDSIPNDFKEYCFQSSVKEDVKDFGHRFKSIFGKSKKAPVQRDAYLQETVSRRRPNAAPVNFDANVKPETRSVEVNTDPRRATSEVTASTSEGFVPSKNQESVIISKLAQSIAAMDATGEAATTIASDAYVPGEKEKLLGTIEELDQENRQLIRQLISMKSTDPSLAGDATAELINTKVSLEARVDQLSLRNEELLQQLKFLRGLMQQQSEDAVGTPSSSAASSAVNAVSAFKPASKSETKPAVAIKEIEVSAPIMKFPAPPIQEDILDDVPPPPASSSASSTVSSKATSASKPASTVSHASTAVSKDTTVASKASTTVSKTSDVTAASKASTGVSNPSVAASNASTAASKISTVASAASSKESSVVSKESSVASKVSSVASKVSTAASSKASSDQRARSAPLGPSHVETTIASAAHPELPSYSVEDPYHHPHSSVIGYDTEEHHMFALRAQMLKIHLENALEQKFSTVTPEHPEDLFGVLGAGVHGCLLANRVLFKLKEPTIDPRIPPSGAVPNEADAGYNVSLFIDALQVIGIENIPSANDLQSISTPSGDGFVVIDYEKAARVMACFEELLRLLSLRQ